MYNKQQNVNNSVNTKKQKNIGFYAIVIILVLIIVASSAVGIFAWAKYISSTNGTTTAQVAKWSFNANLKAGDKTVTLGSETIDLVTTKYNHVAEERIAPGTSGEFQVIIDTTGTEVSLVYDVNISLANCPRNITFSRKAPGETDITVISAGGAENGLTRTLDFSKYIAVNPTNDNGLYTETIYWDWPYELATGTDAEKTAYDDRDKADNGLTTAMTITVTGTEVLENTLEGGSGELAEGSVQKLAQAGAIQRWESVNYNPGTLTTASIDLPEGASIQGSRLASISLPSGASLDGTISATEASDWVVLDVDQESGTVKIIPRNYSSTNLTLDDMDGYNNAIQALDAVASIYKNDAYATDSKSLTVDDVNKVEGFDPIEAATGSIVASGEVSYSWNQRYGMNSNLDVVDYGDGNEAERTYVKTAITTNYEYYSDNFSNWSCWLASRCVNLDSYDGSFYDCGFSVRYLDRGSVDGNYGLFYVNSGGYACGSYNSYPVVPVVTLKSTVHMEKVNDVWQLSL